MEFAHIKFFLRGFLNSLVIHKALKGIQIFKPQLFSSLATSLHTKLTEFFLMNALKVDCFCLREIYINANNLFTLFVVCVVVACLLIYSFFILVLLL